MRGVTVEDRDAGSRNLWSGSFSCIKHPLISISSVCKILAHNRGHVLQFKNSGWKVTHLSRTYSYKPAGFCSASERTLSPSHVWLCMAGHTTWSHVIVRISKWETPLDVPNCLAISDCKPSLQQWVSKGDFWMAQTADVVCFTDVVWSLPLNGMA